MRKDDPGDLDLAPAELALRQLCGVFRHTRSVENARNEQLGNTQKAIAPGTEPGENLAAVGAEAAGIRVKPLRQNDPVDPRQALTEEQTPPGDSCHAPQWVIRTPRDDVIAVLEERENTRNVHGIIGAIAVHGHDLVGIGCGEPGFQRSPNSPVSFMGEKPVGKFRGISPYGVRGPIGGPIVHEEHFHFPGWSDQRQNRLQTLAEAWNPFHLIITGYQQASTHSFLKCFFPGLAPSFLYRVRRGREPGIVTSAPRDTRSPGQSSLLRSNSSPERTIRC